MSIEQHLKIKIKQLEKTNYMSKKNSYIGISFVILIFGIYVVRNLDDRITNQTIIDSNRLNKKNDVKELTSNNLFVYNKVPSFEFTNQDGNVINNETYKGKVYVVEFFFTTCPTICPIMNQKMLRIQKEFAENSKVGIASISITPAIDRQEVLKKYAISNGITHKNWHLLSGKSEETVFNLSNNGFKLYAGVDNKVEHGGFEHSGLFALVDKTGTIRSRKDNQGNPILYYRAIEDGSFPDQINELKEDIKILLNEYN
jgi:protein SCO1/2|tara:strand:+ start:765 stop:1535 length:771 start_codon:yes stop_codon:yes gene_type:complete